MKNGPKTVHVIQNVQITKALKEMIRRSIVMSRYDSEFQSARARPLTRWNRGAERCADADGAPDLARSELPRLALKDSPRWFV